MFLSPADPTRIENTAFFKYSRSSYGANAQVFYNSPKLITSFPDGTSQTIAFGEHYSSNCSGMYYDWGNNINSMMLGSHGASFAEGGKYPASFPDYYPITRDNPPVTMGSCGNGWTFQVRPAPDKCFPGLLQTPHPGGMVTGFVDGSVRTLSPTIAPEVFWGAVTPAGGEVLGDFN
ncbi:MAG TPA: DUF1559 domain-containing protein [Fimbriiglobus sp.]|jgi:prepilin-type processing-associated H-X9-DG protein